MNQRKLVSPSEWLYRRSWPGKQYMNPDGTATSRVFKLREKDNGELSVDVKSLTTAVASVTDPEKFNLFEVPNKVVEENELKTFHDPLPDGANNAHAVIIGLTIEDDIKPGILARNCNRVNI